MRHGIERRSPGLPPGTGRAPLKLDAADLIERRTRGESISSIARGSQRSAGPPAAEKNSGFHRKSFTLQILELAPSLASGHDLRASHATDALLTPAVMDL